MDYLQEGIGLRAHAQRDPLVEYQREGYDMFTQMLEGIKEEVGRFLFNMEVQVEEAPPAPPVIDTQAARLLPETKPVAISAKGLGDSRQPHALSYSRRRSTGRRGAAPSRSSRHRHSVWAGRRRRPGGRRTAVGAIRGEKMPAPGQVVGSGPSRNAPCPCGSGLKYKRCHGAPAGA